MASVDKPQVLSDWLKWESAPEKMFSREKATLLMGLNLPHGSVLGRITATGKLKKYDNGAADGTEVAYGVLYASVDATAADQACVVIVRDAIVAKSKLVFDAGQNQAAKDAAMVDLAAKNILSDRAEV
jgi:hypothetical protein